MRSVYVWLAVGSISCVSLGCSDEPSAGTPVTDPDAATVDGAAPVDGAVDGGPTTDPVVRPLWPPSGATVSGHQPVLRWKLEGAADGARVEFCKDRSCANVIATLDAKGDHSVPTPKDLPAGRVYWRLHGTQGATVATKTSATWEMMIPAHPSAAVQSAYGTGRDYNGDGFDDVVFINGPDLEVHIGGAAGPAASGVKLAYPWSFGDWATASLAIVPAGDVNGDGYSDLLLSSNVVGAAIFYGSPSGLAASPPTLLTETKVFQYGQSASPAGDVDGDGYADVAVGSNDVGIQTVAVFVYGGSAAGLGKVPVAKLFEPAPPECQVSCGSAGFGGRVAGACDVNGDGRPDLLVSGRRGVFEFHGGTTGFEAIPAIPKINASDFPCALDINGDGMTDVATSDNAAVAKNAIFVYHGRAGGLDATDVLQATTPTLATGVSAPIVGLVGDVDGDGLDDVGVRAYSTNAYSGLRGFVFGGTTTAFGAPILAIPTLATYNLTAAGDVNGDARADLLATLNDACGTRLYAGGKPVSTTAIIGWNASGKCLP